MSLELSELYENKVFQFHYSILKREGLVSCDSESMESESDKFPRSMLSPPQSSQEFELPLVNDLVNGASTPHHLNVPSLPSLIESGFNSVSSVANENLSPTLPKGTTVSVQSRIDSAKAKMDSVKDEVANALQKMESFGFEGIEQFTSTTSTTTKELKISKENTASYFGFAKDYLASFGLSRMAIRICDKGLQIATGALKMTGLEQSRPVKPLAEWIEHFRSDALALEAPTSEAEVGDAKTLGEASLLGGMAEVLRVNSLLSAVGLQLVPADLVQCRAPEDGGVDGTGVKPVYYLSDKPPVGFKQAVNENDSGIASEKDHDSCADNDAAVDDTDSDKIKNVLMGKVGEMANVVGTEGEKVMEGVKNVLDVMPAQGRWWSKLRKPKN